jgi:hypothetical protein
MNDYQINNRICEITGGDPHWKCAKDYCNDLNAIAEAETHLSEEQLFRMNQRIWDATMKTKYIWQLTARQRAMALIEAVYPS